MVYQVGHFIDGRTVVGSGSGRAAIYNPATGEPVGETVFATQDEVQQVMAAASQAYPGWANTPAIKRARVLFKFKELLEINLEKLASLVTREHGKNLEDARGSVLRGIELVEAACAIPTLLKGDISSNVASGVDCYTLRSSLGVCVGVSPFNFPVMVPIWQSVWAIACGNTFILKPSEQDPSATLYLAELLQQAGLPDGVFNVVQGDRHTVEALITHPTVQAVTAVASSQVAEQIYLTAVQHGKRAHTFGGAKNHAVVMPDVDIASTADAIMGAAFGSAGERCMALSVVVAVGDATAEGLLARWQQQIPPLKIGPGNSACDLGPLVSAAHRDRVLGYIEQGLREGATLVIDGRDRVVPGYPNGFFLGPCVFDRVDASMQIYQQEIFGPVLSLVRVNSFEEALALTNAHPYGNGSAIFTEHGGVARQFVDRVQAGMVGINVPIPVPVAFHSFGGWKRSFCGDTAMHGEQSVQFYTKLKSVTVRWPEMGALTAGFTMPTHG
jgi:malonate-semialdehyde dehydrogenase (acetylating)/methylmalonate-semialdehyde dehydrogenase